jgi:hypothetical protein
MKRNYFSRKIRQFRNLSYRVNRLIFHGEWEKLSVETRNKLTGKLNSLYCQLRLYFSQTELKKILAAAVIFIGLPLASQAQSFAPPQLNPFGLVPVDSVNFASPAFADIDHDGDFDLFTGNYGYYDPSLQFYENIGTINAPTFAMPQENPFGIIPPPVSPVAFPSLADIDHDGDLDLFITESSGEYNANFQFYENTGTVEDPVFAAPQANPFGLTPAYLWAIPTFADIDNDGDMDLFAGVYPGAMNYYENTGTDTLANFASPLQNPFGITSAVNLASPAFTDIDHDGDLDLFVGQLYGDMLYFENTGTASSPAFAPVVVNPFGLVHTNYYNFPAFADLDDDGDDDLLIGEYYGSFQYFQNTEFNIGITENASDAFFDLYPNPATDGILIKLKDENPGYSMDVSIIDVNGRIVKKVIINSDDLRLKTDDLSPGIYFVRLVLDAKVYSRKLVIE